MVSNPPASAGDVKRWGFDPWMGKIPWTSKWQSTPVSLPGKFYGPRSLMVGAQSLMQLSTHSRQCKCNFPVETSSTRANVGKYFNLKFYKELCDRK